MLMASDDIDAKNFAPRSFIDMTDLKVEHWKTVTARKRASAYDKIPKEWRLPYSKLESFHEASDENVLHIPRESGILTAREIEITEQYDAVSLLDKLASRVFSSVEVTVAFSKRAAIAQQVTCCLTETFFDEALERAKYLDHYLAREGRPVGPLHGLPISLKDTFRVPGVQASIGYVSFLSRPAETEYSALPKLLLDLGAILYVKTNVPQTLMIAETDNNIFGRTLNPHRLSLCSGGSSGGEGSLVAMRGSILGVGTDIGGSIRVPALCCGVYGFKPTTNRIPYGGQVKPGRAGSPGIVASAGPIATSLGSIRLFMDSVISKQPWEYDSTLIPTIWRKPASKNILTIGVLAEDPIYPVHPPVTRALTEAINGLRSAGHKIVYLKDAPPVSFSTQVAIDMFSLDNSHATIKNIMASGEPVVPAVDDIFRNTRPRISEYTLEELFDLNTVRAKYIDDWHQVWVKEKLDVIVAPPGETTSVPHNTMGITPYMIIWNFLDYPSIIIPYGKADKTIDTHEKFTRGGLKTYSPEAVHGAPTSIQLVTRSMFDEELLDAANTISEILAEDRRGKFENLSLN